MPDNIMYPTDSINLLNDYIKNNKITGLTIPEDIDKYNEYMFKNRLYNLNLYESLKLVLNSQIKPDFNYELDVDYAFFINNLAKLKEWVMPLLVDNKLTKSIFYNIRENVNLKLLFKNLEELLNGLTKLDLYSSWSIADLSYYFYNQKELDNIIANINDSLFNKIKDYDFSYHDYLTKSLTFDISKINLSKNYQILDIYNMIHFIKLLNDKTSSSIHQLASLVIHKEELDLIIKNEINQINLYYDFNSIKDVFEDNYEVIINAGNKIGMLNFKAKKAVKTLIGLAKDKIDEAIITQLAYSYSYIKEAQSGINDVLNSINKLINRPVNEYLAYIIDKINTYPTSDLINIIDSSYLDLEKYLKDLNILDNYDLNVLYQIHDELLKKNELNELIKDTKIDINHLIKHFEFIKEHYLELKTNKINCDRLDVNYVKDKLTDLALLGINSYYNVNTTISELKKLSKVESFQIINYINYKMLVNQLKLGDVIHLFEDNTYNFNEIVECFNYVITNNKIKEYLELLK